MWRRRRRQRRNQQRHQGGRNHRASDPAAGRDWHHAGEAARLAKQASFGPTPALIDHIVALKSASAWIDEQLGLRSSTYADLAAAPVPTNFCAAATGQTLTNCNRDNYSVVPMTMRFYANAIARDDQLRQRVAFALSQILVASDLEVHTTAGLATYNQILLDKAFGNYRDILAAVTLNPFMGNFLDMVDSNKTTAQRELRSRIDAAVLAGHGAAQRRRHAADRQRRRARRRLYQHRRQGSGPRPDRLDLCPPRWRRQSATTARSTIPSR
jgi:uncharacterized protein (DUF1800 family)